MALDDDIETVLWSEEQIANRVSDLAAELSSDLVSLTAPPTVFIGVATGAFLFLADLVRRVNLPFSVDFIRAESYGKHVVLVEDIVDTGYTLSHLIAHLESKGVSSVSVCAFLDKPARRKVKVELVGSGKFYFGFECSDQFVVGYGMDFAELYRNLPYIGVLKPERYK